MDEPEIPRRGHRAAMTTGTRRVRATLDPDLHAVLDDMVPLVYAPGAAAAAEDVPPHVRAASAMRRLGSRLVIVQDDVNVLALHREGGRAGAVLLPAGEGGHRAFGDARGNKHAKMDLEACAALPDGRLVAFGSGSTPRRERLVVLGPAGMPRVVEAGDLYAMLRRDVAFAGSQLNVEGAVVADDALTLFQRGNGAPVAGMVPVDATGELPLAEFTRWLDGAPTLPRLQNVNQYDLGEASGVPFSFTDAALAPDGRMAFLACAEASPDAYRDGPVHGCRVGFITSGRARMTEIRHTDGSPVSLKLEGLEPWPDEPGTFHVVADRDDPDEPAILGRLTVGGVPGVAGPDSS